MELKAQINDVLTRLCCGARIDRGEIIKVLSAASDHVTNGDTTSSSIPTNDKITLEKEATPIRTVVSNWDKGICKRCLTNNVQNGDIVVKIYGKGWFHDACYRVVNPDFYKGIK